MKDSGLSLTDTIGLQIGLILNGAFSFFSLKIMSMKGPQLTELFSNQTNLLNLLRIKQKQIDEIASGIIINAAFVLTFGYDNIVFGRILFFS